MKKILLSLLIIAGAASAIGTGATGAFFSDTETSTGNTFAAGSIDLKIDNESYYNLNKCTEVTPGVWQWQGSAAFPVPGTLCTTSFGPSDLGNGLLFFNFTDIKPDDEGEDTISMHVQNDAWACFDMTLTSNDDTSSTDPELASPDTPEDIDNTWDGELAQNLNMFWWADDGDNVYEVGENSISGGVKSLMSLATTTPFSVTLADPSSNAWSGTGPLPANQTMYIAKTWCFGALTPTPVAQDGSGHLGTNGPQARGTGFSCDGTTLNNLTQTDSATVDVAFRAVQSRNNPNFSCGGQPRTAKINVIKKLIKDNGGNEIISDFQLFVDNGIVTTNVTSGATTTVSAGSYNVSETGVSGYVATFSGDCDAGGNITLNNGDEKYCVITNDDLPAVITLIKNVTGTAPLASPTLFNLRVDGLLVQNNTSTSTQSNTSHTISEGGRTGYTFVGPITGISSNGKPCPAVLGGSITLDEGESIICTITNHKD